MGPAPAEVLLGEVTVVPEHRALAAHVRPALRGIAALLVAHRKEHEKAVRLAEARLVAWHAQKRQSENPVLGLVVARPGPPPEPAPPFEPLNVAGAWLEEHLERDPKAERLLLLDLGGTSADLAILKGEQAEVVFLQGAGSERVMAAPEPEREARTREVYDPAFTQLVGAARTAFGDKPFLLVGSGGGLGNPWLRDRLDAAFLAAGFAFTPMVDAATLVRIAQTIRERGLDAPGLARFLAVHERDGGVPGRFDVVDGLLAEVRK
jgi:hypothetical protein